MIGIGRGVRSMPLVEGNRSTERKGGGAHSSVSPRINSYLVVTNSSLGSTNHHDVSNIGCHRYGGGVFVCWHGSYTKGL